MSWGSAPAKRGRLPQESDIEELGGEEWLEPVLVEVDGRDVWLPEGAESEEDVEPAPPLRRRASVLGRLEGLAVVAVLAIVLFVLLPARRLGRARRGRPGEDGGAALGGGGADRRPRGGPCDAQGEAVGIVQHADGLAEVGGRRRI